MHLSLLSSCFILSLLLNFFCNALLDVTKPARLTVYLPDMARIVMELGFYFAVLFRIFRMILYCSTTTRRRVCRPAVRARHGHRRSYPGVLLELETQCPAGEGKRMGKRKKKEFPHLISYPHFIIPSWKTMRGCSSKSYFKYAEGDRGERTRANAIVKAHCGRFAFPSLLTPSLSHNVVLFLKLYLSIYFSFFFVCVCCRRAVALETIHLAPPSIYLSLLYSAGCLLVT